MKFDSDNTVVIDMKCYGKCAHNALIVDTDLEKIECKMCGEKLNPFFAVKQMMKLSDRWKREKAAADLAREQLEKRVRCRCKHCKKMTNIDYDVPLSMVFQRAMELK